MHLEKITNNTEHARVQHNSRKKLSKTSNDKIDPTRSHLNYNLTKSDISEMTKFKQRLSELSYRKQKNNVRMEEIVITAPKNLTASKDLEKFFKTAYEELKKQCGGSKNEISAWVHMDETSPHLHYLFVPGIEVNGIEKLSASKLFNRQKLQQLHPDMQKAIDTAFGHHNYIVVADDPNERQQTSDNLKTFKKKKNMIDKLNSIIHDLQEKATNLKLDNNINETLNKMQEDKNKQLKTESDKLNRQIENQKNIIQQNSNEIDKQKQQLTKTDNQLKEKIYNLNGYNELLQNKTNLIKKAGTDLQNITQEITEQQKELESLKSDTQYIKESTELRQYLEENEPDFINWYFGNEQQIQQSDEEFSL